MKKSRIITIIFIVITISCVLIYHFGYNKGIFFWPELKPQSKEYYISIITDDKTSDEDRVEALDEFEAFWGPNEGFPYALYLADYCGIPAACRIVADCIEAFYDNLYKELNISIRNRPLKSINSICIPYLRRGAEQGDERCIKNLRSLYYYGRDTEQDTILFHYYDSLYKALTPR